MLQSDAPRDWFPARTAQLVSFAGSWPASATPACSNFWSTVATWSFLTAFLFIALVRTRGVIGGVVAVRVIIVIRVLVVIIPQRAPSFIALAHCHLVFESLGTFYFSAFFSDPFSVFRWHVLILRRIVLWWP